MKEAFGKKVTVAEDDEHEQLQKTWTNQPYSRMTQMRKLDLVRSFL